jgi:hypothetical protein
MSFGAKLEFESMRRMLEYGILKRPAYAGVRGDWWAENRQRQRMNGGAQMEWRKWKGNGRERM